MLNKIKTTLKSEDKKALMTNFLSLTVLHGVNYILPLITLPYLLRVIGIEKVGLITFAQAFMAYFVMLTEYGFNLSATREVSIFRNDKEKISEIYSSVMTIKAALTIISAFITLLIVFSFKKLNVDSTLYIYSFGLVIGQALFPAWFFQGMERMKYITLMNLLAKLLFTTFIFIFINKASDYIYVPLISSFGYIVAGLLGLGSISKKYGVPFKIADINNIKARLKDGWHIFISRIFVNLYSSTNIILLGAFTNNTVVGIYSVAEKISSAISGLGGPFNQAIYPYLAKIHKTFIDAYFRTGLKLLAGLLLFFSAIAVIILIFADNVIMLVVGKHVSGLTSMLRILAFTIVFYPLGTFFTQILIIHQKNEVLSRILLFASLANFALVIPMILLFEAFGLAITVLIIQLLINLIISIYLYREILRNYFSEKKRAHVQTT